MNLEQLRKQAKELARAARAGEPAALARLGDLPPRLASAQLVLAREHGYPAGRRSCVESSSSRSTPTSSTTKDVRTGSRR